MSHPHNVIFDHPIRQGPIQIYGDTIESIDRVVNVQAFRYLVRAYMVVLFLQYGVIFASTPFEGIENRPAILVIAMAYNLVMFMLNVLMLPCASSTIPSLSSLRCWMASSFLEFVAMGFNVAAVIACLTSKGMVVYDKDEVLHTIVKRDVTIYLQVVFIICLVLNVSAYVLICFLVRQVSKGLDRILNKIDRTDHHIETHRIEDLQRDIWLQEFNAFALTQPQSHIEPPQLMMQ